MFGSRFSRALKFSTNWRLQSFIHKPSRGTEDERIAGLIGKTVALNQQWYVIKQTEGGKDGKVLTV